MMWSSLRGLQRGVWLYVHVQDVGGGGERGEHRYRERWVLGEAARADADDRGCWQLVQPSRKCGGEGRRDEL